MLLVLMSRDLWQQINHRLMTQSLRGLLKRGIWMASKEPVFPDRCSSRESVAKLSAPHTLLLPVWASGSLTPHHHHPPPRVVALSSASKALGARE